jgi:hypothetical protein
MLHRGNIKTGPTQTLLNLYRVPRPELKLASCCINGAMKQYFLSILLTWQESV